MSAHGETQDFSLPLEEFVAAWKQFAEDPADGQPPEISDFLNGVQGAERVALFRGLLDNDLHYREKLGNEVCEPEYEKLFPDMHGIIRRAVSCETKPKTIWDMSCKETSGTGEIARKTGRTR